MRYEIKLILDHGKLAEFLLWMDTDTTAKPVYYPRTVNSLYYDNMEYQAIRDNLTGISDRRKVRLRWYHQTDPKEISGLALELKMRTGRLGSKDTLALPTLETNFANETVGDIMPAIIRSMIHKPEVRAVMDEYLIPIIHLNYLRTYFVDMQDIRITIDQDIRFYPLTPMSKLYDTPHTSYPQFIAEIKFDPSQKRRVAEMMRGLNMTPKRHSKYLAGMASLGQVIYI